MPDTDDFRAPNQRIRTTWNETRMLMRGPLTDRRIERYQREGWYSEEFRRMRRERMARKQSVRREGSWLVMEGRAVYSPR